MITKVNIREILTSEFFGFRENRKVFSKDFGEGEDKFSLSYNYGTGEFIYPAGVIADRTTTTDDHQKESYVTFLCVAQLFAVGYKPNNLKLEGKNYQGNDLGWIDILVSDNSGNAYLIIECKTADVASKNDEFRKHWARTLRDGDQLFRYFNTYRRTQYLCLYSADYPEYKKNGQTEHQFENIYNIISLVDNDDYLRTNPDLASFRQTRSSQGGSEDFFKVWKNTYRQDFISRGLLEKGIEPFKIARKSYNIHDLNTINEYSLGKKYNEFALILRKHTISSHENAFDKLVNLFIAKIIDEKNNPKELKVLWKGAAYDDYFSLQDRLNVLYREGMRKFFNDEVTYIENRQIDEAFKFLSSKADEGKETIKRYFRKLKYFNNNPFAFLDVHNEQLFYNNAVILKDVIVMLQDIYLTSNENNQFLGDLFEGFLNKGVHQSEGQFFTPMPIVRFLVSSLPLKTLIGNAGIPNVLDYACGAGHFLTEYAQEIQPLIRQENTGLNEMELRSMLMGYFSHILGIEKDYRLSKVSQVAAFMYGMDGIKICFSDGLVDIPEAKRHSFNILVANPPYAVSGFLETLPEEERSKYQLSKFVSNIEKNNTIETFFVERASQMLASGGVAAIILPASVLTKGSIYMHMREIILRDFDIVAISNFGPSTFGQTSTSTVALFLRRKPIEPDTASQVMNRVDAWFAGNFDDDEYYNDEGILDAYVERMGYEKDDYIKMLCGELTPGFMNTDMATEYSEALNIPRRGKNSSSTALNTEAKDIRDKAQKEYSKNPTPTKRLNALKDFIRSIEKEKLYYYMLAASDPQPVVIVQSPLNSKNEPDKEKEKKFLGYEWSNRKGNEGIHYLNTGKLKKDSENGEDEDDETLAQITSIDGIQTPLFNPQNLFDEEKINSIIRNNFDKADIDIPIELENLVKTVSLMDMMDFSKVSFMKDFIGGGRKQKLIESKYQQERLSNICKDILAGGDRPTVFSDEKSELTPVPVFSNGAENDGLYGFTNVARIKDPCVTISARGTLGFCSLHNEPIFPIIRLIVAIPNEKVTLGYLYEILSQVDYVNEGSTTPQLSVPKVRNYKVPVPPISVQDKIVNECKRVNQKKRKFVGIVNKCTQEMRDIVNSLQGEKRKISKICYINTNTVKPISSKEYVYVDIDAVANGSGVICWSKRIKGSEAPSRARRYATKGSTLVSTVRPNLRGFAFVDKDVEDAVYSTGFAILKSKDATILPDKMIYYQFMFSEQLMEQMVNAMPKGSYPSINRRDIENFEILVSVAGQNEILQKLNKLEDKVRKANEELASVPALKQAILDRYLK